MSERVQNGLDETHGALQAPGYPFALGLPSKLLLLTIGFVMIAEIFIFAPSVADFRRNWLTQRLVAAKIASLALEASGGEALPEKLRQELLMTAGVHAVSLRRPDFRKLVLGMPEGEPIADVYDLRANGFVKSAMDGFKAFTAPPGRLIRVIGAPDMMPEDEVDIVIDETPLRAAMWGFAGNIFWVSLLISAITAALVYIALIALLVRPMMRLTRSMVFFRESPQDTSRIIAPSRRRDEIGVAERELAALQTQLSAFLREKSRLANIGLAVSKINHDLRNMLASAQIVSGRLAALNDPSVQRFAPRLIRALDRAIGLCVDTLKYGRSQDAAPVCTRFPLRPLLLEVRESLGLDETSGVRLDLDIPPSLDAWADRDHLFRVFSNLVKNAVEASRAIQSLQGPTVTVSAFLDRNTLYVHVKDNGPGIPPSMRPMLFEPFHASRPGEGSGLGLAICAELLRAHGGTIALEETASGASFAISLPHPIVEQADFRPGLHHGALAQSPANR